MSIHTRLLIERQGYGSSWEIVAYPADDLKVAREVLKQLRQEEQAKKYKRKLRLVREIREYYDM